MSDQINTVPAQSPQIKLGEFLRDRRMSKKTVITELARTLILSPAQITALETGSQASFHNQTFYLRALKKYMTHMDLAMDPQASLLYAEIETELLTVSPKINVKEVNQIIHTGLASKHEFSLPNVRFKKSYFLWLSIIVFVLIGLTVALLEGWPQKQAIQQAESVSTPAPAPAKKISTTPNALVSQEQKTAVSSINSASSSSNAIIASNAQSNVSKVPELPLSTVPNSTATTVELNTAYLKLTFLAPSWVQAVEQNGKRVEKVFTPQDVLELDPATLSTLVIGNARDTKLFVKAVAIDLSKYVNAGSGVARLNQTDIMKLGQ